MPVSPIVEVKVPEDFERVYDMPDPRSYYRALRPLDYRAPEIVASYLRRHGEKIAAFRGRTKLKVLDFSCGYGAVGALVHHELSLAELYDFYAEEVPADPIACDRPFFAARRSSPSRFELAGLDIAEVALGYAQGCSLIDRGFADNLVTDAPGPELSDFLSGADLVVESGGVGAIMVDCYRRMLAVVEGPSQPWFLNCPRPDWDHALLWDLLRAAGYVVERVSVAPIRYRKVMGAERELVFANTRLYGRDPGEHFEDDYYLIPLLLSRPRAEAARLPIEQLRDREPGASAS